MLNQSIAKWKSHHDLLPIKALNGGTFDLPSSRLPKDP